jgi:hypothetical protein
VIVKVEFWPEFTGKGPIRVFPVLDEEALEQALGKEFGDLVATDRAAPVREWVLSMDGALDAPELHQQGELEGL